MAIKGPDLALPLISDLSLGAKGSVFKGSLSSLLQLVMDSLLPLSLHPSIHLLSSSLSNTPSFIYFISLQVSSSWLLFPTPAANPVASSLSVSLLSKRSRRVLTSFFNGCYTSYGQPCHSLPSLSLSLSSALSNPFSFILSLIYIFLFHTGSALNLPPGQLNPVVLSDALFDLCCHVGFTFPAIFQRPRPHKRTQCEGLIKRERLRELIGEDFNHFIEPCIFTCSCYSHLSAISCYSVM